MNSDQGGGANKARRALGNEAEAKYRSLFDHMADGFELLEIIRDEENKPSDVRTLELNRAYETQIGSRPEQLVGRRWSELGIETQWFDRAFRVAENGEPERYEDYDMQRDRFFEASLFRNAEDRVGILFRDITDRKRAEEAVDRERQKNELLADVTSKLLSSDDPQRIIDELALRTMRFLDCDVFFNYLADEERGGITLNAYAGVSEAEAQTMRHLDLGAAVCGRVAQGGKRIVVEDIQSSDDDRTPFLRSQDVQAYACHPLIVSGETIGTLSFGAKNRKSFGDEELSVMKSVADHIALAMKRIIDNRALQRSEEKYRTLFDSMDEGFCIIEVIYDEDGSPIDYRFLEMNPAFEKQTGIRRGEKRTMREIEPDHEEFWFQTYGRIARTGIPERFVHEARPLINGWYEVLAFKFDEGNKVAVLFNDITERQLVAESLKRSEERFRSVLDSSLDAIYRFNLQTGRYVYVSPSFERVVGRSVEEMSAKSIEEAMAMIHPDDVSGVNDALARLSDADEVIHDYRLRDKKGEYRWISNHISLVKDEEGRPLYRDGVIRNVTEQKAAEQVLRANEERHAFVLRLSDALRPVSDPLEVQEVVAHVVMEQFGTDRCYYSELVDGDAIIRSEAPRVGLPSVVGVYEMTKLPIFQAVVDAGRPFVVKDANTSELLDESLRQMCIRLKVISFIDVPVIKNGRAVGILCIVHGEPREWTELEVQLAAEAAERTWEAMERASAEEALRKSEARYRGLFENLSEVILIQKYVLDDQGEVVDFSYVDLNPATEKALKKRRDELIGKTAGVVFGQEYIDQYIPLLSEIRRTSAPIAYESYFQPLDRYYFSLLVPLDDELFINAALDITDIKQAQRQAEDYAKGLEKSNAELQQFAYVASHDLQEPLRMVTSYIGLLEKKFGNELNPQAKQYMRFAVDGSMRMRELIDDLLQYSRIDSHSMVLEKIDMNDKVQKVVEDLHVAIKESGAEIIVNPLPTVCADRTQIKQLMTNLISNAIKFHGNDRPSVEVSAVTYANEFVFAVKDNGIGIDPRYHDKLFKMFSRLHTRDEYPGSGIGLAISKKIVERHGGKIWFESVVGKGTTFYFTLPSLETTAPKSSS